LEKFSQEQGSKMTGLNIQQKQLIFDYSMGIASESESAQAQELIFSNEHASLLHAKLKKSLSPLELEAAESEDCPQELVDSTVARLMNAARSSHLQLQNLLANEQIKESNKTQKVTFIRNFGQILAYAAIILIVSGIVIAPLQHMRQNSWKQTCGKQLGNIGGGFANYVTEHNGQLPTVASSAGSPWWKVGYSGNENHSNTRNLWLLVKGDYVNPVDFVCPGKREGKALRYDAAQMKAYNDFPSRKYVSYSFRIRCPKAGSANIGGQKVLIADLSPLFETLPENNANSLDLQLNNNLLNVNSINHNRKGQSVLLGDGSVKFVKTRNCEISNDDIYTIRNTTSYNGSEVPSCDTDAFLAP
jgi:hypothetical protein